MFFSLSVARQYCIHCQLMQTAACNNLDYYYISSSCFFPACIAAYTLNCKLRPKKCRSHGLYGLCTSHTTVRGVVYHELKPLTVYICKHGNPLIQLEAVIICSLTNSSFCELLTVNDLINHMGRNGSTVSCLKH